MTGKRTVIQIGTSIADVHNAARKNAPPTNTRPVVIPRQGVAANVATPVISIPSAPPSTPQIGISTQPPVAESAGVTASAGTTGSASDSGHVHALPAGNGGSPPDVGDAAGTDGTSGNVARADHTHTLPIASASVLGGIKVGSGLSIAGDGTLSSSGGGGGSSFLGMTLAPPVLADWTSTNMPGNASASTDSVHGGIIIVQGTGTSNQPCITKTQPTTPYTIEVGYMMTGFFNAANSFVMIGWYDSGTGHLYGYIENKGSGNGHEYIQALKFTNFTFSATTPNQFIFNQTFPQLRFVRIENDGTNLTISISQDGVSYVQFYQTSQASSITPTDILLSACSSDGTYGVAADFVHYYEH